MMKVFISYAHSDEALAQKIVATLGEAGLEVWNDHEILPGDNWAEQVAQALKESEAMVVLLTPEATRSRWVRHEIEYALGEKRYSKRLIPVLVGDSTDFSQEDIPWILWRFQMIKLAEYDKEEEGIQQIAQALREAV